MVANGDHDGRREAQRDHVTGDQVDPVATQLSGLMRMSPHQFPLGFDEQQAIVTGACPCGWTPEGRYFLNRQVREEFNERTAAEAAKA